MPRRTLPPVLALLALSGCAGGDAAAPTAAPAPTPAATTPAPSVAPMGTWTYRADWTRPDGQPTGIEYQLDVRPAGTTFRAVGVQTNVDVTGRLETDPTGMVFVTLADSGSVPAIAPGTRLLKIERNGDGLQVTPLGDFSFENAGGAASVFFGAGAPAASDRSIPFQVTVTPDARARARLEKGPEDIEVLVTFTGSDSNSETPNEREVRMLVGPQGGTVQVPATDLTPARPGGAALTGMLISVYSARKSAPDNLLSCTVVSGETATLLSAYDVSCTLI